ncbi:DNA mismatch endonuclease Vsr [Candidatus Tiddalikarchaeum anstoanum]|nr:DNA mismatch endonuclease Vsr [Candidatus Tiddalikarchaeum anstoanum]
MDTLTKKQRSYCMSRIRSKWTKPEIKFHNYLKGYKIKHKMHPKVVGSPDIILSDYRVAVFVHGCFWHKCKLHFKAPKSNKQFWEPKIKNNVINDKKNEKKLKQQGYKIFTVWEHDIKHLKIIIKKILTNT